MRAGRVLVVVVAMVFGLVAPAPAVTAAPTDQQQQPPPFSGPVYYGDCRDVPSPCVQDPWTGNLSVGPHLIREGEKITLTFALEPGGVDFTMPGGSKLCGHDGEARDVEVQNAAGRWEIQNKEEITASTCTYTPGPTNGQWQTMAVDVIGPCGSQIAVQEGRAEFAACAGTFASDYYGVIGKDEDLYGISGRVTLSNGRGMAGVPISVSGPESRSTVTGTGGDYAFAVKKGTYRVSAGAKVCVSPQTTQECSSSTTVTLPGSRTVDFRPPAEAVIKGTVFGQDSKPAQGVDVHVVGQDGLTVTSDDKGHYEARVPKGTFTVSASKTTVPPLPPGAQGPAKPDVQQFCADDHGTFPKKCTTQVTTEVPPDHVVNWALPRDPNDIQVELTGEQVVKGTTFVTTMKVTNPRDDDLTGVKFDAGGLANEVVVQVGGTPVTPSSGGQSDLPTTLPAKKTLTLRFRYDTPYPGEVVQTANVSGALPDGKVVKGTQAMTVNVGRPITRDDLDRQAVDDLTGVLDLTAAKQRKLEDLIAKSAANDLTPHYDPVDLAVANQLGISVSDAHLYNQSTDEAKAMFGGFASEFSSSLDKFGKDGGQLLASIYGTLEDPEGRRQLATSLVEGAKKLGPATLQNLGYLGQAILATQTPEGVQTIIDANGKMLSDVGTALDEARVGSIELSAQNDAAYKKDPIGYRREQGKVLGGATFTGMKEAAFGALGEAGVRGIVAVAPKALEAAGLRRIAVASGDVDATAAGAGSGGTELSVGVDEATAAARRLDLAEQTVGGFQDLEAGTVLDDATLTSKAGLRAEDAKALRSIIDDANAKFGIDLEIGARTSEPLSAGIDGVAKREFIKPKAISTLDKLLGGEESLAGRASVFDPKMPPPEVLKSLESKAPGITEKLQARFNDQAKLYKEFKDPDSALRQLTDAAKEPRYAKGVTAVVERPGYTFPAELTKAEGKPSFAYLEQLDEFAFTESRGITPERAAEIKQQLSRFPDQGITKLQTKSVNGTTTFIEGTQGKPIVSDLDLQFVEPKGGWPPGQRGQIEAYVNARMKQIGRFPQHGWSDAALDVPADYFEVAAKFKLNTTNPALAKQAAKQLETKFKTMAKLLREQASKVKVPLAGTDAEFAAANDFKNKLLAKADKLDKITADYLLEKYPPGEKIIVFTAGDARVGYSTGGR